MEGQRIENMEIVIYLASPGHRVNSSVSADASRPR
jgi:hypothetical protein